MATGFDIADASRPQKQASAALAVAVDKTVPLDGKRVLRIGGHGLDVVSTVGLGAPALVQNLLPLAPGLEDKLAGSDIKLEDVATTDAAVFALYRAEPTDFSSRGSSHIVMFDTPPDAPVSLRTTIDLPEDATWERYGMTLDFGSLLVASGSTLVAAQTWNAGTPEQPRLQQSLRVIDLADPEAPRSVDVSMPLGPTTRLLTSGSIVARSRYRRSEADPTRVRFYLDRIDISDPGKPVLLPSINIPGSVAAYDAEHGRALTVDYRQLEDMLTQKDCHAAHRNAFFMPNPGQPEDMTAQGTCTRIAYSFKLIAFEDETVRVLGELALDEGEAVGAVALGEDRVFAYVAADYWLGVHPDVRYESRWPYPPTSVVAQSLVVISGLSSGEFATGRVALPGSDFWEHFPVAASGTQALVSSGRLGSVVAVSAERATQPTLSDAIEVGGEARQISVLGDSFVVALGPDGVQELPQMPRMPAR